MMPFKTNLFYSVWYCKTLLTSAKESGMSSSLRRETELSEEREERQNLVKKEKRDRTW